MSNLLFNTMLAKTVNKVLLSPYAKIYEFTISEFVELENFDGGNFTFSISNMTDEVSYLLIDSNSDEVVVKGVSDVEATEEVLLQPGDYKIIVQPNKSTEKPVRFTLTTDVDNQETQVVKGDTVILYKFSVDEYMKCDVTLNNTTIAGAGTLKIYKDDGTEVFSKMFNDSKQFVASELESGNYLIQLIPYGNNSSGVTVGVDIECKCYKVGEPGEVDSNYDNVRENSIVITFSEVQNGITNWVGPGDSNWHSDDVDWYKITGVPAGTRKIHMSVTDSTVGVVSYANESTTQNSSFNVTTANSPYSRNLKLTGDCDLYFKITKKSENTFYSLRME